jgi:O-antigen ligase
VSAVGAAIAVVAIFGLLSRLHPAWFPGATDTAIQLGVRSRLSYPLNYWNGVATLIAVGIPLVLVTAGAARSILARALAAAALPAMALAALYTFSRGGAVEIAIALVVLFALHPRRLQLLPTAAVAAAGSAILVVAATQRHALENGLGNSAAHSQGSEMLVLVIVVCAGVALLEAAIALTGRHLLRSRPTVPRRAAIVATALAVLVAIVVAVAGGVPGYLSDRWHDFKAPTDPGVTGVQRFDSASGNGRYQLWQAAVHGNATNPVLGIGPGTYEYYWTQHRTFPLSVVNAHSLYLESLAELGIVGLILIIGVVGAPLVVGTAKTLRARGDPDRSALFAAATAALAVFAVAAAVDWVWQLPAIVAAFLLVAAAVLNGGIRRAPPEIRGCAPPAHRPRRRRTRVAGRGRDSTRCRPGDPFKPERGALERPWCGPGRCPHRQWDRALRGELKPPRGARARAPGTVLSRGCGRRARHPAGVDQLADVGSTLAARGRERRRQGLARRLS